MNHLIILRTWAHGGLVSYSEHSGPLQDCKTLVDQARATAYRYSSGDVVNAFNAGRFAPGWRFGGKK